MWKLSEKLLNYEAKETKTTLPNSRYVTADIYPEQNRSLLNKIFELTYQDQYKCNVGKYLGKPAIKYIDGKRVSLRPDDDNQFLTERQISDIDGDRNNDVWANDFLVLRADIYDPYVFIAVSVDCSVVIVSSTKTNAMGHYEFLDNFDIYAIQYNEFFGRKIKTHYMDDNFINDVYLDADILRIDKTDQCKIVLMEYLNNKVRFVLGNEVTTIYCDDEEPTEYINDYAIPDYRRNLLEGKSIYG